MRWSHPRESVAGAYFRDDSVSDESFVKGGIAKYVGNVASADITAADSTGYDDS